MKIQAQFSSPDSVEAATEIQQQLRPQVNLQDDLGEVCYVAGVDVGFRNHYALTQAAIAVLTFPELELVETSLAIIPTTFPYIPGFLSFREIPAILKALQPLSITPDLLICDGQGIAHPRRLGIASHLGVLLNMPTIGVAKSLLVGKHEEIALLKDNWQPLIHRGETVGAALRSRNNVKPIYISPGHRISLPTALDYVMRCLTQYRLPETTRLADKLASGKR